jgi:hypothetical protein
MSVSYKELGLSNTREMFAKAMDGGYAIPGYNFNNMEQIQAIIIACLDTQSPVILQVSAGARKYANETLLRYMAQGAVAMMKEMAKEKGLKEIPITLHCMALTHPFRIPFDAQQLLSIPSFPLLHFYFFLCNHSKFRCCFFFV